MKSKYLAIVTICALTAVMFVIGVTQAYAADDSPVKISLRSGVSITDKIGQPIIHIFEKQGTAEEEIIGKTKNGQPVYTKIYSRPLDEPKLNPLASDAELLKPDPHDLEKINGPKLEILNPSNKTTPIGKIVPTVAYSTTSRSLSLTWEPVQGAKVYVVRRDGIKVAVSAALTYAEIGLSPDTQINIAIEALGILPVTNEPLRTKEVSLKSMQLPVRTLPIDFTPSNPNLRTYQPYSTAVMYKTFIRDLQISNLGWNAVISCSLLGQSGVGFKGDGRGFVTPRIAEPDSIQNYRTMMFANVNWGNPPEYSFQFLRGVGLTKKTVNGVVTETRTANMDKMRFYNQGRFGDYAWFSETVEANDPFCSIGAINYTANVQVYRSGLVTMKGSRRVAPNHEIYARFTLNGQMYWTPMLQAENEGFNCLTDYWIVGCPTRTFDLSKTG